MTTNNKITGKLENLPIYEVGKCYEEGSSDDHIIGRTLSLPKAKEWFEEEKERVDDEYDIIFLKEVRLSHPEELVDFYGWEDLEEFEIDTIEEYLNHNFFYTEEIEWLDSDDCRRSNDETDNLLEELKRELANHYGFTFSKYTSFDDEYDFSFTVRIADHSQRFANIKSDYSISIVVADKDATEGAWSQKGFGYNEIESGFSDHAQIYITSELDLDAATEFAIESIDTQLQFAKENHEN